MKARYNGYTFFERGIHPHLPRYDVLVPWNVLALEQKRDTNGESAFEMRSILEASLGVTVVQVGIKDRIPNRTRIPDNLLSLHLKDSISPGDRLYLARLAVSDVVERYVGLTRQPVTFESFEGQSIQVTTLAT